MSVSMAALSADTVVVFDFETTGLSPEQGHRPIEVGAVLIEQGKVVDQFQALMNPGLKVDPFIEQLTGISNEMLANAESIAKVMKRFSSFIEGRNLVAHNVAFDQRFLATEFRRLDIPCHHPCGCTLLLARRLYQMAPSHSLSSLIEYKQLPIAGDFHRALADAQMTGNLWLSMLADIEKYHRVDKVSFAVMQQLSKVSKQSVPHFFQKIREQRS